MDAKKITLITGGIRSGKSRYALSLAEKISGKKIFLATAQPMDDLMTKRIKKHREERGDEFMTVEEPLYLAEAIKKVSEDSVVILIDCLTLWVNNLLFYLKEDSKEIHEQFDLFLNVLTNSPRRIIVVTNEIGLGVIPENPLAITFVDELGFINQRVAQLSDEVFVMVAGLPQCIKACLPAGREVNRYGPMDYSFSRNTTDQ